MNRVTFRSLSLIFPLSILLFAGCNTSSRFDSVNRDQSFNPGWKFLLDSVSSGLELPAFDDSQWQNVDLPHDWSIMGIKDTGHIGPFPKKVRELPPPVMCLAEPAGTGNILRLTKKTREKRPFSVLMAFIWNPQYG